jgi:hypothetical protein
MIDRLLELTPPTSAAVILFPDEFEGDLVSRALALLDGQRPDVLAVIVTKEPRRFEHPSGENGKGPPALVIPRPAWAWTILDAIRARLDSDPRFLD